MVTNSLHHTDINPMDMDICLNSLQIIHNKVRIYFQIQTNFGKWILAYQIQSALISILSRQIGISHSNSLNALFNEFDRQKFLIGNQRSGEKKQLIFSLIFFIYF